MRSLFHGAPEIVSKMPSPKNDVSPRLVPAEGLMRYQKRAAQCHHNLGAHARKPRALKLLGVRDLLWVTMYEPNISQAVLLFLLDTCCIIQARILALMSSGPCKA